jgi:hypothetical protein
MLVVFWLLPMMDALTCRTQSGAPGPMVQIYGRLKKPMLAYIDVMLTFGRCVGRLNGEAASACRRVVLCSTASKGLKPARGAFVEMRFE